MTIDWEEVKFWAYVAFISALWFGVVAGIGWVVWELLKAFGQFILDVIAAVKA